MDKTSNIRRNHDGFLKYIYSVPKNAKTLLNIAAATNADLERTLAEVNLDTLEEIPEPYNEVGEHGEADLAFRVKGIDDKDFFFGILLEHKSSPNNDVLAQIYRYTYEVMVNKSNTEFAWMPTKAIIIYNGTTEWDPLAKLRKQQHEKFQGKLLPFECAFVNLATISDEQCFASENSEAAIGLITMKYAFNARYYESLLPRIEEKLKSMDTAQGSTLVDKIKLYLGEYLNPETLEELKMAFVSIGQRLGFVSAGDLRRAQEKEIQKLKKESAANKAEIAANKAEIAALKAALAQKG